MFYKIIITPSLLNSLTKSIIDSPSRFSRNQLGLVPGPNSLQACLYIHMRSSDQTAFQNTNPNTARNTARNTNRNTNRNPNPNPNQNPNSNTNQSTNSNLSRGPGTIFALQTYFSQVVHSKEVPRWKHATYPFSPPPMQNRQLHTAERSVERPERPAPHRCVHLFLSQSLCSIAGRTQRTHRFGSIFGIPVSL